MSSRDEADRAFDAYLRDRDPDDLARVFDRTAPRLLLLAGHLVSRPGDAEELVQATFVRALEIGPERFVRGQPVLPWLCGILAFEAKKLRRDLARSPDPHRIGAEPTAEPSELAEFEELRATVEREVQALPDGYAQVLTLRLVHGLTPAEIAHALGLSPDTVKTRLRRGVERLRIRLPTGFAALLAFLAGAGRSLGMVRDAVLATAGVTEVAAVASATVARSTLPRLVAAAVVGAAGLFGALRWFAGGAADPAPVPPVIVAADPIDPPGPPERVSVDMPSLPRAPSSDRPPAAAPIFASLEGRLRDVRGAVTGVEVTLVRLGLDALLTDAAVLPAVLRAPPLVVGTCVSDSGGRYLFERIPPGGVWLLRFVVSDGMSFVDLVAARPEFDERVDLGTRELPYGFGTEGRIVDPRLRVIEGATVRRVSAPWTAPDELGALGAVLAAWNAAGAERDALVVVGGGAAASVIRIPAWLADVAALLEPQPVVTGADGRFAWRSAQGPAERLLCSAPGFAPTRVDVMLSRDDLEVGELALQPYDDVEITVLDPHGRPVADAAVALGIPGVAGRPAVLDPVGTTGPDGVIKARHRAAVTLVAAVREPGAGAFHVVELPPRLGRTIRLPARHPVRLRCVEANGTPVAGVEIRLLPGVRRDKDGPGLLALDQLGAIDALDLRARSVRIDDDAIVVSDVPEGDWVLVVGAAGHAARAIEVRVRGPVDERVELAPLEPLRVDVLDSAFHPLRGVALVGAVQGRSDAPLGLPVRVGRTGDDASCRLLRERWQPLLLGVVDPGRGVGSTLVGTGAVDAQVVVRGTGASSGVFASARQEFRAVDWLIDARPVRQPGAIAELVFDRLALVAARSDGVVHVGGMTPGSWRLSSRRIPAPLASLGDVLALLWPASADWTATVVDVRAGSATSFRIDPLPVPEPAEDEPWSFRGRVSVDGSAPVGLRLALVRGAAELSIALDENGDFDAGAQPAGDAELVLRLARGAELVGWWRAAVSIVTGAPALAIDIPTAAWSAQLTGATGARADGAEVWLDGTSTTSPAGRVSLRLRAEGGGFIMFEPVPAGRYTLRVMDPQRGWLSQDGVRFGHPQVTTGMSIRLEPLLRASGVVAGVGIPIPRTSEVELVRSDPDGVALRRVAVCREGGGFAVDGLLPGRYAARLRAAVRRERADGAIVIVGPELSGIEVPLADVEVPPREAAELVLRRR